MLLVILRTTTCNDVEIGIITPKHALPGFSWDGVSVGQKRRIVRAVLDLNNKQY